ncbi:MAG: ComEC/Rec2 family competence protein [Clostridia bacterium]|nr:ComEC/Rec2 family competence protein [Clostridia bacterium]
MLSTMSPSKKTRACFSVVVSTIAAVVVVVTSPPVVVTAGFWLSVVVVAGVSSLQAVKTSVVMPSARTVASTFFIIKLQS